MSPRLSQMLNGIQVARGVAAIFVVMYHASVWSHVYYDTVFNRFFNFGYIGVDFFFVLSGFIIFYIHKRDSTGFETWKKYFLKRIIRIYPPFLPISLLLLFVSLNWPDFAKGGREIGILSSIFLLPGKEFPALEVAWTLTHEMLFYLFFSFYFFFRKIFPLLSALWMLLICANLFNEANNYLIEFFLNPHNIEFFFGIMVAIIAEKYGKYNKTLFVIGIILLVLFILDLYLNASSSLMIKDSVESIYLGITFSFILYGIYGFDRSHAIVYPSVFIFLGSASYSVYLIHYPLVSVLNRISSFIYPQIIPYNHLIFFSIILLCILGGCLYHLLFEIRATNFLKSRLIGSD